MSTGPFPRTFSCGLVLAMALPAAPSYAADNRIQRGAVSGYTHISVERGQETYNAGFSVYSAAWPLLQEYPGHRFQSGLFGTWMFAQNDRRAPGRMYSDIEGGLGWWRGTVFPTETPKFIMGGVALNFSAWANGPGAGKGRDWSRPQGKYGVAQLSPWLLFPPDGLNLKQGTCGELFGYGYVPMPLTKAKATTAGKDVPTGDHCWTLFLSTANFKGPVAFFTPYFWSRVTVENPSYSGMFLDSRPSRSSRSLSMETQYIPCAQVTDAKGQTYARIARTLYPAGPNGESVILHRVSSYSKKALWDGVKAWFDGGAPVNGSFDAKGTFVHRFTGRGGAGWKISSRNASQSEQMRIATDAFMHPVGADSDTFAFRWDSKFVTRTKSKTGELVMLPEYYRLAKDEKANAARWLPVEAKDVPAQTGLARVRFGRPDEGSPRPLVTPEAPDSCWKRPGPSAGPFKAKLGDGSTVTYYWYRFADQPALLNADLTDAERQEMQKKVEKLHRHWPKDRDYLAPPTVGKLAEIDPALIVTPPRGLEVGYVPIATRQALETK